MGICNDTTLHSPDINLDLLNTVKVVPFRSSAAITLCRVDDALKLPTVSALSDADIIYGCDNDHLAINCSGDDETGDGRYSYLMPK